ncbi:zinc finger, CCHC-type containing protein [Tanacetum coccineum]
MARVHGVHDEKRVWFEVELHGAQGDGKAEVFQQEKEYQTGWKIKTGNVLDSCNQMFTQQCMNSGVAKHLGVAGIQQQNGLVDETNATLFTKVRCFLIQSGVSKVFWAEDTTRSTHLVNRSPSSVIGFKKPIDMLGFFGWLASIKQGMLELVKDKCIFLGYHESIVGNKLCRLDDVTSNVVLYRNMGFNESEEYKKTFIGSGVDTGSMQVLHGFEFKVEPLEDHTFEVEPQENVDQEAG